MRDKKGRFREGKRKPLSEKHKIKIKEGVKKVKEKWSGKNNLNWKGGISQDYYQRIAFENFPNLCNICSSLNQLRVHHKDRNKFNNDLNNLIIVCKSCHNKIHDKWKNLHPQLKRNFITKLGGKNV